MRTSAVLPMISVTLGIALSLSGCSASGDDAPEGFSTLEDVQAEYDAEVADFPYALPDGVSFPKEVQQPRQETIYQEGSGLVQAYQFWECSWMDHYLVAQGTDQEAADDAIAHLEQGANSTYRTEYMIDDDNTWVGVVIARAKLGDPGVFSDFYEADCVWYRAETGQ